MDRKYPNLCKSIKLGNVNFRNRIFSAPMGGTDISPECNIGQKSTAFYELRAKGGAAAVTVSEVVVHPETDASHMFHLNLETPGSLSGFAYTADAIRRHGAIPSIELSHSGQYAGTYLTDKNRQSGMNQWGPSDGIRPDGKTVKALSTGQIEDIIISYGRTASVAKRAGFEMVMVHGGHGWLINQFLSPYFNKRKDKYGGSLENRVRMAAEVLQSVRRAVGSGFPIEFRMSGSELIDEGYDLDEGVEIARLLEPYIDLLHVSAGTYQTGFGITHPSMFMPHGCNVYMAEKIKKNVLVPVATVGGLNDPEMMEEILASKKADVIAVARGLLADHELPKKVLMNQDKDIVKCLRCFTCMSERADTGTRRCTVNPLIGREVEGMEIALAPKMHKVLVAGGGPGGLIAALTAARRGHEVILCERDNVLGGILKGEQAIPFKYEMYELGVTLEKLVRDAGVEIRMNTEVTKKYADEERADVLIAALGSEPCIPPIPGIDSSNVVIVNDYYLKKEKVGAEVAVLGGGLAGCEIAVHLAMEGKTVHLIEMADELAPDANRRHRPLLLEEIRKQKIVVHTQTKGLEIRPEGVRCQSREGEVILIPGNTVIAALGQIPRSGGVEDLLDSAPLVFQVGDCVRASNITNAIYQGFHAALDA